MHRLRLKNLSNPFYWSAPVQINRDGWNAQGTETELPFLYSFLHKRLIKDPHGYLLTIQDILWVPRLKAQARYITCLNKKP